mgnify:CR=1 FL=1
MNEDLIAGLQIEGMHPARQRRTRQLVLRMMQTALELLADRDFDGLSVEDLSKGAGATTGSFYARFESKAAFIHALQRVVVAEGIQRLEAVYGSGIVPDDDLERMLTWIATGGATWYRNHEGLVRASLRRASHEPHVWQPMFELGQAHIRLAMPRILALAGAGRPADDIGSGEAVPEIRVRVAFAFQILHSTLNNIVLIDPGPYRLHDAELPRMLTTAMMRLIAGP